MNDQRTHILMICFGMMFAGYVGCSGGGETTGGAGGATGSSGSTSSSSSKSSSKASSTSGPSSVTSGGPTGALGTKCKVDADCSSGGFKCIAVTADDPFFGGGPAGGYCSKDCAVDADCGGTNSCAVPPGSAAGLCILGCTIGPALKYLNDKLDPAKCYGRNDLRCEPLTMATNGCLPTCGSDSQCPTGRVCDPRFSVCVDKANVNTGKPEGAKCDPKSATECAGVCVSFGGTDSACSESCVIGGVDPTITPNCGGITSGLCIFRGMNNGAGDFGFCANACKTHDTCQNPTFWCQGIKNLTGMGGIDNGFCLGAIKCPKGQADCTNGGTCTPTNFGPFCIDPMFPLGNAGSSSSSASSSSSSTSSTSSSTSTSTSTSSASSSASSSSSSSSSSGGGGAPDAGPG